MKYRFTKGLLEADSADYDYIDDVQKRTMELHQEQNNQLLRDYMNMAPHYMLIVDEDTDLPVASMLLLPAENVEQATSMPELETALSGLGLEYSDILIPTSMDVLPEHRGQNLLAQMLVGIVQYAKSLGRSHLLNFTATTQAISDYGTTQVKKLVNVGVDGPDGRPMLLVSLDDLGLML